MHNERAIERGIAFGDRETLRNAQLNLGDCHLGRGDVAAASGLFDELEAAFAADVDPGEWMKWRYRMHLWMGLAQTWLALDEPERALPFAERCLQQAETTGTKRYVTKGRRARGLALSALGRHDEALAEIEVALVVADEIGGPEPVWQGLGAKAEILAAAGRVEEGRAAASEALDVIEGITRDLREPGLGEVLLASPAVRAIEAIAAS
jgi:tetratricopeptide (TPR) repeat protein